MRLTISHRTSYHYDAPVGYALQQLRLRPKDRPGQTVKDWKTIITGGAQELEFDDEHMNHVQLVALDPEATDVVIEVSGIVEVEDRAGVVGEQSGFVPLWLFSRATPLTKPGPALRRLAREVSATEGQLAMAHALMAAIADQVKYLPGSTGTATTAEEVLTTGQGVCQDHAHVFVATARLLGLPARYVSGYLMMPDRTEQDATHAWAEAHVENLGWVGFDVSNRQSPDDRYVRVATGLDYAGAAPIRGMRYGQGDERLHVAVSVATGQGQSQSQGTGQEQQ
jgi:transglutaminase-like putative cysteine protease